MTGVYTNGGFEGAQSRACAGAFETDGMADQDVIA